MAVRQLMSDSRFVSVVVPTHNRAATVAACVRSLLALDHPKDRYEIVVVDAASTDDTRERIGELATRAGAVQVTYLRAASRDANAARNAGIAAARGDPVALVDDDVLVPPGWVSAIAAGAMRWPEADCLGGPVRPIFEGGVPSTCAAHELAGVRFDEGGMDKEVREVWGGNMALRRSALERTGLFREGLRVQQEWEWEQRLMAAGGRIVYLADAWLWHRRRDADLEIAPMLREFFLRGYFKGALGQPIAPGIVVRRASGWLLHAVRSHCTRGVTESTRHFGLLCGAVRAEMRRRARRREAASPWPADRPTVAQGRALRDPNEPFGHGLGIGRGQDR
jgi:glycosyltransferase involved in cell wall biosynthesis